jgi:hypothetical protein
MELNPIIVVHSKGIIIFADGKVVFPQVNPNPELVAEIAEIANIVGYVAKMRDSKYRTSTLETLNAALEEKAKMLSK